MTGFSSTNQGLLNRQSGSEQVPPTASLEPVSDCRGVLSAHVDHRSRRNSATALAVSRSRIKATEDRLFRENRKCVHGRRLRRPALRVASAAAIAEDRRIVRVSMIAPRKASRARPDVVVPFDFRPNHFATSSARLAHFARAMSPKYERSAVGRIRYSGAVIFASGAAS